MITSPRQGLKKTETRAESPKNCSCSGGKRKPPWKSQGKWKYISVRVTTSNICDLRVAIFENSNLPLVATILEKCSRSKERFPFTSSISALFGTWEHTDLLIYFSCWIWKRGLWMIGYLRMLFKPFWWNNTKICDIVIYVYILTNFIYKFRWLTRAIINVIFEIISHVMNSFF